MENYSLKRYNSNESVEIKREGFFKHPRELFANFLPFCKIDSVKEIGSINMLMIPRITHHLCGFAIYSSVFSGKSITKNSKHYNIYIYAIMLALINWACVAGTFVSGFSEDIYAALEVLPMVMAGSVLTTQVIRLLFCEERMIELYSDLMNSWENQLKYGLNETVIRHAKKMIYLSKIHFFVSLLLAASFIIRPLHAIAVHFVIDENKTFMNTRVLPTSYPFEIDTFWKYILCIVWEAFAILIACIGWTAIDTGFIQSAAFLALQLQVVEHEFRNIVKENDFGNDRRLINRFKKVARKHDDILSNCSRVEELFNPVILAVMISTSVSLGVCSIYVEKELSSGNFFGAIIYFMFCVIILLQTAAFCDAGESISSADESILQAIYECKWNGQSERFKRLMVIMMTTTHKSFTFKTYGLYHVRRDRFTKIVIIAFDLISVLRTVRFRRSQ